MALGFGSTEGSGPGDRVVTSFTTHATQRSYGVWVYRSDGGDEIQRVFEKRTSSGQVELVIYNPIQSRIEYEREWSGFRGRWSAPTFPNDTWTHLGISYDSSSSNNDAVFYENGIVQSVSVLDAPSGSVVNNSDPYVIGNRGDGSRTFGARLAEFAIWNRLLSQGEWTALGAGVSPMSFPQELRCYVPLIRDGGDLLASVSFVSGTQPKAHPRILRQNSIWIV